MKKPYIKKYITISGFTVWIVDGEHIRNFINEEFTNFGQHFRFKFIPKKEFWIDKEYGSGNEMHYFIDHLLIENRLMSEGIKYNRALERADKVEKAERKKHELIKKEFKIKKIKEPINNKIHKKLLKEYSKNVNIWIINGKIIRDLYDIDFTEGGHDKVYKFIPKNEVWIDDDLKPKERAYVILHELHERNLMAKGMEYHKAHRSASAIEYICRHKPNQLNKKITIEIKKGKIS